jgi:hypothetical protein
MKLCAFILVFILALAWSAAALPQNKVRTETFRPPGTPAVSVPVKPVPDAPSATTPAAQNKPAKATAPHASKPVAVPEIIADLARLPAPVARMRERILAAARSGDIDKVVTVMQSNETMPIFSFTSERDPAAYWKANYPNSNGVEVLSILITILESGFVHVDKGTPQEMYVWPYFARMPIEAITPQQKVDLFRIITGADYKDMIDFGAYVFYRLGIGPEGTWHFFVAGD